MQQNAIVRFSALALAMGLAACGGDPKSDNELYNKLAEIMDHQNRQWKDSKRTVDVSYAACHIISEDTLMEMTSDPALSGTVKYKFYETSMAYPDNTKIWTITRPLSFTQKQVLMIELAEKSNCYAVYRHSN